MVGDRWFDDNFNFLPNDEDELIKQPRHLGGSTRFGSAVSNTIGVYPVELQAMALAMFPGTINERDRFRSSARSLLQLIDHLCKRRKAAGGDVYLSHVPAHTNNVDQHSVGNRMADFEANRTRLRPSHPSPLNLDHGGTSTGNGGQIIPILMDQN